MLRSSPRPTDRFIFDIALIHLLLSMSSERDRTLGLVSWLGEGFSARLAAVTSCTVHPPGQGGADAIDKENRDSNAAPPNWLAQVAALRELNKVVEGLEQSTTGRDRADASTISVTCFCAALWEEHHASQSADRECSCPSVIDALCVVCKDLRSQLVRHAAETVALLAERALVPTMRTEQNGPPKSVDSQRHRHRVSRRELREVQRFAMRMGAFDDACAGRRRAVGATRPRSRSDASASYRVPDVPATGAVEAVVQGHRIMPQATQMLLRLLQHAAFPLLLKTKQVFSDAGDQCARRVLAALCHRRPVPVDAVLSLLGALVDTVTAGSNAHPQLRERCAKYIAEYCLADACLGALNGGDKVSSVPESPGTATTSSWQQLLERCITKAITDSSETVRSTARRLHQRYTGCCEQRAERLLRSLAPEDRRRLQTGDGCGGSVRHTAASKTAHRPSRFAEFRRRKLAELSNQPFHHEQGDGVKE